MKRAERERTPWRTYARLYGVLPLIPDRLGELLDIQDRWLVRGGGHGPRDSHRGEHRALPLIPSLLEKRTHKRESKRTRSERTYRRAISDGERLGLLLVHRRSGLPSLVSPAWWRHPADRPEEGLAERVWSAAAALILAGAWPERGRSVAGYPVRTETGPSASVPNGIRDTYPGQTGATLRRCNASTLVEDTVRDTVCASAPAGGGQRKGQRGPRPLHRPRKPLPIQDRKLRERAEQTIRETEGESSWKGLEALVRIALRTTPEELVVSVLREAFNLWETGSVQYPKGWIRERLGIPCSLGENTETRSAPAGNSARTARGNLERIAETIPAILPERPTAPPETPTPEQLAERERARERAREQAEQEQKRAAEQAAEERIFHQESREYQAQGVRLAEGNPARWSALLAVREQRDLAALRELVALWKREDRSLPPVYAQRTLEAHQEALCAL
jgi:hypothetical protein